ncbi:MAG: OsmC family protein [Actinomycetota bacterium]
MATITADLVDSLRVEVRDERDHVWIADEPTDVGGNDTGPTPYELLLSALAACTLITLRIVADREEIPLDSVSAKFTYDRIHADDCTNCDDDVTGFLDQITTEIFLDGSFDEQQRARLERVATICPVHKTLERGIHFNETIHAG